MTTYHQLLFNHFSSPLLCQHKDRMGQNVKTFLVIVKNRVRQNDKTFFGHRRRCRFHNYNDATVAYRNVISVVV